MENRNPKQINKKLRGVLKDGWLEIFPNVQFFAKEVVFSDTTRELFSSTEIRFRMSRKGENSFVQVVTVGLLNF